jgi:hypothetical protein
MTVITFAGPLIEWRGPSPFHFVALPEPTLSEVREMAKLLSYGWGVVPVLARSGETEWSTSLFPKSGGYLLPIKDIVRKAEAISLGQTRDFTLTFR